PLTYTSQCQSTAPKCNKVRPLRKSFGTDTLLLYHRTLSFPTSLPTPDKADSIAKGTSISPSQDAGISEIDLSTTVYFHNPLKLFQLSLRSKCGLGYSGCEFSRFSCSPHFVKILLPAGFQPCA